MKKLALVVCVLVFMCCAFEQKCMAGDTSPGELYARGVCLMDGDSGRILYGKNETQEMAMASTTKIMTCILLLENCELTEIVTASENAARQPKVRLGVYEGEQFLLEDLLYALMLESYNDAAVMLAEHLDGTVEAFAARMNEKAELLGCEQTHFVTPNGLDGTDHGGAHHTTAKDLATIMRYCVRESPKAEEFIRVTRTNQHSFSDQGRKQNGSQTFGSDLYTTKSYSCANHNQLFHMTEGVISGKTGFTNDAGYCYVCAVESEGRIFIITLLGCGWPGNKTWKWKDTLQLLDWAKETFTLQYVLPAELKICIPARNAVYAWSKKGQTEAILAEKTENFQTVCMMKKDEKIHVHYRHSRVIEAPAEAGMVCGEVTYWLGDVCVQKSSMVLQKDIRRVSLSWCMKEVLVHFLTGKDTAV